MPPSPVGSPDDHPPMRPSPTARRRVGVRQVAELAGVSRQTVSRVLNDHPDVAADTRERVLAAMKELGYRINHAARALGTHRTHTIGVLASNTHEYGPSRSLVAVEAAARARGFWLSAAFVDSSDVQSVLDAVEHLLAQGVEALVVVAPHAQTLDALRRVAIDVPVVTLHAAGHDPRGPSVDQVEGARLAVGSLADAGHRRIGHLAGPADWLEAGARRQGMDAELLARGLPDAAVFDGDWTARSGHAAAGAVLASGVTGVFCANDQMAIGLLGALQARGVAVPRDVSLVGFDDIPESGYVFPSLTTVRQDFEELARRAIELLVATQTDEPCPDEGLRLDRRVVAPVLVTRDSVAAPPAPLPSPTR